MTNHTSILNLILHHYASVQAVYLFGSYDTENERPWSDVDIALLLPPQEAQVAGHLILSALHADLASLMRREVDLINLRLASTVLQKEVIMAERRIYVGRNIQDKYATDEFEMLTLSYYQKLNEERAEILQTYS